MEEKPNMKLRNIFESLIINETYKNLFTLANIRDYMKTLKEKLSHQKTVLFLTQCMLIKEMELINLMKFHF